MNKTTPIAKCAIWLPIVFSLLYSYFNYLYVRKVVEDLSYEAQIIFHEKSYQLYFNGLLILFPNALLSLFLWLYARSRPDLGWTLFIPCLSAIAGGISFILSLYSGYSQLGDGSQINQLIIPYGFPFTYFFGMAVGWVFGMLALYSLFGSNSKPRM